MVYFTFVGMNSARLLSTKRSPTKKPMKVIRLEEYRKAKRIQEALKKQENVISAREAYKEEHSKRSYVKDCARG